MSLAANPEPDERPERLFTRADYHAMVRAGILTAQDRVELIDGKVVSMMPIGPWHASSAARLLDHFHDLYGKSALVVAGNPVGLGDLSEPQPDVTVLRRRADYYSGAHPEAADVLLLIEISDSSLNYDLTRKRELYAAHGVAEYWVIDGRRHCVHVFRNPMNAVYQEAFVHHSGDTLPLPGTESAVLPVSETGV